MQGGSWASYQAAAELNYDLHPDQVIDARPYFEKHDCEEPGCDQQGGECVITDYSNAEPVDIVSYYCAEHAEKNGYCRGCGLFCAGIETFDFGRYPGHCDNCQDQIDHDNYDRTDPCDDYEGEYPW